MPGLVCTVMADRLSGGYTISVRNQPRRLVQPCIPLWSLNWVLALAGAKVEMSALPGGR